MRSQRVAVLDLGTNTFNLLLVKITPDAYYIFRNEKIPVKLGKDGINDGMIIKDAQKRALDAIEKYNRILGRETLDQVYAYATSAFRDGRNGIEFKKEIENKTGIQIHIISGDLEAEFIYKGVKTAIDIGGDPALIMDIGGGSVEFIIGNRDDALWKRSYNIGAQRLLDWFHKTDPIPAAEIGRLEDYLDDTLNELFDEVAHYKPKCLIGSSGTFDTLSDIYQFHINRFSKGDEPELPLTLDGFNKIHAQLLPLTREQRILIPGMIEMRADMMVVASCLVDYILRKTGIQQIRISAHSLKEGMITVIQEEMLSQRNISIFNV